MRWRGIRRWLPDGSRGAATQGNATQTQSALIWPAIQGASEAGRIVFLGEGGEVVGVQAFADPAAWVAVDDKIRDRVCRYKVQARVCGKWRLVGKISPFPGASQGVGSARPPAEELQAIGRGSLGESATKFLALGFDFHLDKFDSAIEELAEKSAPPNRKPRHRLALDRRGHVVEMKDAIMASVGDLIEAGGQDRVSIGVTGGLDSRLIHAALRHVLPADRIFPFTFGYPGQYDFEFVKTWISDILPGHHYVETREIGWSLEAEILERKTLGAPGAYSSKPRLMEILYRRDAPRRCFHGFMGDTLLGSARMDNGETRQSWEIVTSQFLLINDRWHLQDLFSGVDLKQYLPPRPAAEISGMDDYAILDFGLRQRQRILTRPGDVLTPYADERWIRALLSIENLNARQECYFDFIRDFAPDMFPEIVEFGIASRKEHDEFRSGFTRAADMALIERRLKNDDGADYFRQLRSDGGGYLHGRQFCDRAEYSNSPGFAGFIDESLDSLRGRAVFPALFLDRVWENFIGGSKRACEQVKGLVSFEVCLRAGVLSL